METTHVLLILLICICCVIACLLSKIHTLMHIRLYEISFYLDRIWKYSDGCKHSTRNIISIREAEKIHEDCIVVSPWVDYIAEKIADDIREEKKRSEENGERGSLFLSKQDKEHYYLRKKIERDIEDCSLNILPGGIRDPS